MSRDIRSFFTVISKKTSTDGSQRASAPAPSKQKTKRLIDSDDDDVISATPDKVSKKREKKQKVILSSDSEDESRKKVSLKDKKSDEQKLKPVDVADVFKNTLIKQAKVEVAVSLDKHKTEKGVKKARSKKKNSKERKVHDDADFEKTLDDLDDDTFEKSIVDNLNKLEHTETLLQTEEKKEGDVEQNEEEKQANDPESHVSKNDDEKQDAENTEPPSKRKRSGKDSSDSKTPKKKKIEHSDSGIDPGQEAHEKKRYSAMLYQKYLNRSGPKHHGTKELPKGKPDCLKGLCFLRTGVLDSLESGEFDDLIKQHSGRVVSAVSGKVNYVVVGEDPGPSKLEKARSLNIPTVSEDELLDLILTKSGMDPKYCKKHTSSGSEDLGIETDDICKEENLVTSDAQEDSRQRKRTKKPTENVNKAKPKEDDSGFASRSNIQLASSQDSQESCEESHSSYLPLTEKYKPQTLKAVIGQQGEDSNLNRLKRWLENWRRNQDPEVKKSLIRPSPWARNDNGAYFKCALLSGPPGVGKTTTATLVAKELGLDIVEFNASDTRSKKSLHEEVSQLLSSKTIAGFATGQPHVNNNRVLLMDEVDGMAGNEDRGGMQELIQLIKNTSVPIVCMCNDRNHQKIRSLVNYCFDLRFTKPKLEQIRGAMMSICFKENINIPIQALTEIISGTDNDVRQTLNHLALLSSGEEGKITTEVAVKEARASKKDSVMGPWEVCRVVFTKSEHKDMSVGDKARLFFFDYSLGPLFIQENYLRVQPDGASKRDSLLKVAFSADSISMGDVVDARIRRSNNWALLESQAFFSSVLPGHHMSGHFTGQINFPLWLGKNSKKNKFKRLVSEIQSHTRTSASASKLAVKLDYLVPLRNAILSPLQKKGMDGVGEAVEVMKAYSLVREDVDSLLELSQWMGGENPMSRVDSKVKSAFTRAYNKRAPLLPYAPTSGISRKRAAAADNDLLDEDEIVSDNEDDEDISKNSMIKIKKLPSAKVRKTDDSGGTSKKQESKKGKGKKSK